MSSKAIARRYARALLAIGKEDGHYLKYGEELNDFATFLKENKQVVDSLTNPLYNLHNRKKVLEFVLEKAGYTPISSNFLKLLLEKNRVRFTGEINEFYRKLTDELQGISTATIISATDLSGEVVKQVQDAIAKITNKQIRLKLEVDPSLIGGIVTRVGDLNFDGSVRTQLLSIKESLKRGE
ncbi:MAG: ATP synthase F1 subunit delta [Deltaproteobacteria bacterium]|nr:ATP synthase F1 subunit delta [Deltaproteobacteria bacterium]